MAEAGQIDHNKTLQGAGVAPEIDRRPEWKAERGRLLRFIADKTMEIMTPEEMKSRARASVTEKLFFEPDHLLISRYEKLGGEWSEIMWDKYRG